MAKIIRLAVTLSSIASMSFIGVKFITTIVDVSLSLAVSFVYSTKMNMEHVMARSDMCHREAEPSTYGHSGVGE